MVHQADAQSIAAAKLCEETVFGVLGSCPRV